MTGPLLFAALLAGAAMFGRGIWACEAGRMTTGNAWLAVSGMAVIVITITTGIVLAFMAMG